ncbi:TrmH family RNA methyltransferase [Chitinibacteraceae bacterium HSL-7]
MERITSQQNALYKHLVKLVTQRRERAKSAEALLDGAHLLAAALDAGITPQRIFVNAKGCDDAEIAALLARTEAPVQQLDDALFAALTELPSPSGVLALIAIPEAVEPLQSGGVLVLDGVQDPGNVGTLLRTAAAAGMAQVWLSPACADIWSPKVLRAGMGAQFVLPVIEKVDLPQALSAFSGDVAVTLLDDQARSVFECDLSGSLALVLGSEGQGVTAEVLRCATLKVFIPMHAGIESLNVGAAAAVCLFERLRQRSG